MHGADAPALTAPDGAHTPLSYTAAPAAVCTVDSATGALTLVGVGTCTVTVTAEANDHYNEATAEFVVTVEAAGTVALTVGAIAGDGTVNIAEKTAGFAISGDTGPIGGAAVTVTVGGTALSATSAETDPATWSVMVPADAGYIVEGDLSVTVDATKAGYTPAVRVARTLTVDLTAPTAAWTPPATLQVGVALDALMPVTDDTDIETWEATGLPPGLAIDADGTVSGTPTAANAANATATVTVTDTAGNPGTATIIFPAVTVPPALALTVGAIAGDNTVNIAEKAAGFAISGDTGPIGGAAVTVTVGSTELSATSTDADPATWSVQVPADATALAEGDVTVTVDATKAGYTPATRVARTLTVDLTAPTVAWTPPATLQVGVALDALMPVTDDTDIETWEATGLPPGLAIDADGTVSGTPTAANAANATATVTVTDTAGNPGTATIIFPAVTVPPALALTVGAIAGDNTVNIAEKAAGFAISGDTGPIGGAAVTVTVGSTELSATSTDADPATWSVQVPADATALAEGDVTVTVDATKAGYTPATRVARTLTVDLTAPTVAWTPPATLQVGVALDALMPVTDDTDIETWEATGLPPGLAIDADGTVSGTPTAANAANATATVTVTDTAGNPATVDIAFPAVSKGTQDLSAFAYAAATATHGADAPAPIVPDGPRTTLSYTAAPAAVCTVDSATGALTLVGLGDCTITATAAASDDYEAATATFTVTVEAAGALALTVGAIAGDGTVNIAEKTAGFAISGDTGPIGGAAVIVTVGGTALSATSAETDPATWSVMVPADAGYIVEGDLSVTVEATKAGYTPAVQVGRTLAVDLTAPAAAWTPPATLQVGAAIAPLDPVTDHTDIVSWSATGLPPGLAIDAGTGTVSGTPTAADAAATTATVALTDGAGNPGTADIAFPAVAKGDQDLSAFAYATGTVMHGADAPALTAPDGAHTPLSYTAAPAAVCTVDSATGALTLVGVGTCTVTVTAEANDHYNEATAEFVVTVEAAGTVALTVGAIAGDGTVNIAEKTAGFAISGDTGPIGGAAVIVTVGGTALSATSAETDPATWSVTVPADAGYIVEGDLSVTVDATKAGYTPAVQAAHTLAVDLTAPAAAWTAPVTLQVGAAIAPLDPVTDHTDIVSWSATGLPPGLAIDAGTGTVSGTPTAADAATATATVTVTDTAGNSADASITFPVVDKGDQKLADFSYKPDTVTFGDDAPTVAAPTGARTTLSYSATPATVCTVDSSTGELTLLAVGKCKVTVTAESSPNYNEATAEFTVTVESARTLALTVGAIAGDGTVNIAEKTAGFAISGDTGPIGGAAVIVTVGGTALSATSAETDPATWSVMVPADAGYIVEGDLSVTVEATKAGYTPAVQVGRTLAVDLTAPAAAWTPPVTLQVGAAIAPLDPVTDHTDIVSWSATGLPPGLAIDAGTGTVSGTPTAADAAATTATVALTDGAGNPGTADIAFPAVAKGDQDLSAFAYATGTVMHGADAPALTAPDGAHTPLSYTAAPAAVCTVDSATGALTLVGVGTCTVTVTAEANDHYNEATAEFVVTVEAAGTVALTVGAIAGDGTVNIAEKTAGFAISGDTGPIGGAAVIVTVGGTALSATSAETDPATWSVTVPADAGYIVEGDLSVTVDATKAGYTPAVQAAHTLAVDLTAPAAAWTAPATLQVGAAIAPLDPVTDHTDIVSWSATGLPPGLATPGRHGLRHADGGRRRRHHRHGVTDGAGNPGTADIAFPAVAKGDQTCRPSPTPPAR